MCLWQVKSEPARCGNEPVYRMAIDLDLQILQHGGARSGGVSFFAKNPLEALGITVLPKQIRWGIILILFLGRREPVKSPVLRAKSKIHNCFWCYFLVYLFCYEVAKSGHRKGHSEHGGPRSTRRNSEKFTLCPLWFAVLAVTLGSGIKWLDKHMHIVIYKTCFNPMDECT